MLCSPVRRRSICKLELMELLLDLVRQRHLQSRTIGAYTSSRRGAKAQSSCASGRCCVRRSRLHLGPYASAFGEGRTALAFQVASFQPDKDDSIVRLICNLKQ